MAFTILANSTTADASEVMGNFYFVGAGDRLPYFQTTAGGLSAIDNTYDLGSDTSGWRRAYIHTIGDSSYSYAFNGQTVSSQIGNLVYSASAINVNSSSSLQVDCTTTMQQIYNPEGLKGEVGPFIKTRYLSIGAWDMVATASVYYDISSFYTTTLMIIGADAFIIPNANILNLSTAGVSDAQGGYLNGYAGYVAISYDGPAAAPTSPVIYLTRFGGLLFDTNDFNSSTDNRGYIVLKYFDL